MGRVFDLSEAGALALHACVMMAADADRRVSVRDIAAAFRVSEAHLAKVLQRLARFGIVASARGAGGGFVLAKDPSRLSLLEIYEAVEGPLGESACLFKRPACLGGRCIFGSVLERVHRQAVEYLSSSTLAAFAGPPAPPPSLRGAGARKSPRGSRVARRRARRKRADR